MMIVESFKACKRLFFPLFPIAILYAVLMIIPNGVHHYYSAVTESPLYFAVVAIMGFIEFWFVLLMLHRGYYCYVGDKRPLTESIGVAFKCYPVAFVSVILLGVMSLIGFFLLLLPGIFIYISCLFYLLFILVERRGIIDSLKASFNMIWGHWWRTFGTIFVPVVVFLVVMFVLQTLLGVTLVLERTQDIKKVFWDDYLLMMLMISIFIPWFVATIITIFETLRNRRV